MLFDNIWVSVAAISPARAVTWTLALCQTASLNHGWWLNSAVDRDAYKWPSLCHFRTHAFVTRHFYRQLSFIMMTAVCSYSFSHNFFHDTTIISVVINRNTRINHGHYHDYVCVICFKRNAEILVVGRTYYYYTFPYVITMANN